MYGDDQSATFSHGATPRLQWPHILCLVMLLWALPLSEAQAQHHGPLTPWGATAAALGRPALTVGGGWPGAFGEVDFSVNEDLGIGVRVGFFYGSPQASFRLAQGVLVEIPVRYQLLDRASFEMTLDATAGMLFGIERDLAVLNQDRFPEDVTALAPTLTVGITFSLQVAEAFVLKLGAQIPTTLVFAMVEDPVEDVVELNIALAARVGLSWAATDWMSVFVVADAGPALVRVPMRWTSEHWEHEIRVEPYLRATAGVCFTPWR